MLQNIRDRMTGIVAGVIVGLLVITFGLWGIGSYFTADADPVAVKVGDEELTASSVDRLGQNEYQNQLRNYERFRELNPNALIPQPDAARARARAVEQWTNRTVMQNYAGEQGYRFTNAQVAEAIRANPQFQIDGKFSAQSYTDALAAVGNSPARYEYELRQQGQLAQLDSVLRQTAFVTPSFDEATRQLAEQQRKVAILKVDHMQLRDGIEISDADLQSFYDERKDTLTTDAEAKLNYILLEKAKLDVDTEVSQDVLQARYERDQESFEAAERRKTRHILINNDTENAEAKIADLREQLVAGADFAELAKANSQDPGSAQVGGDLGFVTRGQMVAPFEEAMFSQAAGELSDVVESRFGYHLIKVDEIEAESTKSFDDEEVQEELVNQVLQERRDQLFEKRIEDLRQVAFELDSLEDVAQELAFGAEVQTTDFITQSRGTGIASEPVVRNAAFSTSLVEDGRNSEVIRLPGDRAVVLHMAEYKAPETLALEDVSDELKEELTTERAKENAKAKGDALAAALRSGKSAEELANADAAVSLDQPEPVGRNATTVDAEARRLLFRMPKPAEGASEVAGVALRGGDYMVLQLQEVVVPEAKVLEEEQQDNRLRGLANRQAQIEGSFLFGQLREAAKVDVDQEAIDAVVDR